MRMLRVSSKDKLARQGAMQQRKNMIGPHPSIMSASVFELDRLEAGHNGDQGYSEEAVGQGGAHCQGEKHQGWAGEGGEGRKL